MPTRLLKFQTEAGEVLIAAAVPEGMVQPTGFLEDSIAAVNKSLTEALTMVSGISESFRSVFDHLTAETAEVELGLQFTAKGSVYVVEATGEASLKIKLSFKHKP